MPARTPRPTTLQRMEAGYARLSRGRRGRPDPVAAVTEAFGRFRVLCAVREGPRGVDALNAG